MMFLNNERQRITIIPFAGLAGVAGFTAVIGYWHRTTSDLVLFGAIAVLFWSMVLERLRSVRRAADLIEVWRVYGSQTFGAKNRYVAVTLAGRGPMRVELIEGKTIERTTAGTLIVHQSQLGVGRTMTALETAGRIAATLGLGEPLLAPWLESERGGHVSRKGQPGPRRHWRWPPRIYWGTAVAIVIGVVATALLDPFVPKGWVTLVTSQPHDLKTTLAGSRITNSAEYRCVPGAHFVEVWSSARGCWVRRDLMVKDKQRTSVNLDRLVVESPCATDAAAHTPPVPPRPRFR